MSHKYEPAPSKWMNRVKRRKRQEGEQAPAPIHDEEAEKKQRDARARKAIRIGFQTRRIAGEGVSW